MNRFLEDLDNSANQSHKSDLSIGSHVVYPHTLLFGQYLHT